MTIFWFKFPSLQVNNGLLSVQTRKLETIKKRGRLGVFFMICNKEYYLHKNKTKQKNNALKIEYLR